MNRFSMNSLDEITFSPDRRHSDSEQSEAVLLALLNRAEQGGDDLEEDLDKIAAQLPREERGNSSVKPSPFKDRKSLKSY